MKKTQVVLTSLEKIQDPVVKVSTLHTGVPPPSPARLLQGDRPEQHPRPHRDRRRSCQQRGVLVNTLRAAAAVPCQALTVGDSKAGIPVTRSSEAETLAIGNSRGKSSVVIVVKETSGGINPVQSRSWTSASLAPTASHCLLSAPGAERFSSDDNVFRLKITAVIFGACDGISQAPSFPGDCDELRSVAELSTRWAISPPSLPIGQVFTGIVSFFQNIIHGRNNPTLACEGVSC